MTSRLRLPKDQANLLLSELIGKEVEVKQSPVKGIVGLKGVILDETQNTFLVQTPKGRKRVTKRNVEFFFPTADVTVQGSVILVKPEERIKKLFSKTKK